MLAHFGRETSARELRRITGVSRDCLSAIDMKRAAQALGLGCRASTVEPSALMGMALPVIVHTDFIHFSVLEAIDPFKVRLNCPNAGLIEMPRADFDLKFTGIVLSLTPGPEFRGSIEGVASEAAWWLRTVAPAVVPVVAGAAVRALGACAVVGIAVLMSSAGRAATLGPALIAATAILPATSSLCFLAGEERAYRSLRDRLADHLLQVPHAFHAYRLPQAILPLFEGLRGGAAALTRRIAPALGAPIECVVLLGGATALDASLGLASTVLLVAWSAAAALLCAEGRAIERSAPTADVDGADRATDALEWPANVRLGLTAQLFRTFALGRLATHNLVATRTRAIPDLLSTLPFVLGLALLFAVAARGSHETGKTAALAFLACALAWAAAPLAQLRGVIGDLSRTGARIADILDEPIEGIAPATGEPRSGRLEVRQVTFRYNPHGPPVLHDVSFHVAPGEQVGLSGPSGGGKTSLVEIILGLLRPERGIVLLDGIDLRSISPRRLTRSVLRVDRASVVVEGTLRDNLLMGDRDISEADLDAAIADAALDDVVRSLCGSGAKIEAFGRNLSGGQIRRLEIARALARNPRVLILDDAVDDLDLRTERKIRANLRRRGCSVLVVTHRAASLDLCDRVVRWPTPALPMPASPLGLALKRDAARPAPPPSAVGVGGMLDRVARLLATASEADGPQHDAEPRSTLDAARMRGLSVRAVRVRPSDWDRAEGGPVLVSRSDGSPSILDARPSRTTSRSRGIPTGRAGAMPTGYELAPTCPPPPRTLVGWNRAVLAGHGVPVVVLAGTALVEAASLIGVPLGLAELQLGTTPIILGLLLATTACLAAWRLEEEWRVRTGVRRAHREHWIALCLSTAGGIGRTIHPADLVQGFKGLSASVETASATALKAPAAAFAAAAALAGMALLSGPAAFALGSAAGATRLSAALGGALAMRRSEREAALAERRSRQRLAAIVFGMLRLRGLGADRDMMDDWRETDDRARAIGRQGGRWTGAAEAVHRASGIWLLVASASIAATPSTAIGVTMSGWILLQAVDRLGSVAHGAVIGHGRRASARRLLEWPREARVRNTLAEPTTLSLRRVSFAYPRSREQVLSGLDLDVDLDAVTVITGPSGGGKSTALDVMLGFLSPDGGHVALGGTPFAQVDLPRWRRGIAGVFQADRLRTASTICGHLWVDPECTLADLWEALDLVDLTAEVAAMPMGIQTIVESGTLSAGQQQRLLIARALVQKPRLLVLDEATNAIPDDTQVRLLDRLRAARIGCLAVSHRETMIMAADAVHVVDRACLFSGTPAEMRRHPAAMALIAENRTA